MDIINESNWEIEFKKKLKFLNEIPSINWGGCAIAAVSLYKWFKKHNLIEKLNVKLIYTYYDQYQFSTNSKYLNNEIESFTTCSHALISVNNQTYDSSGKESVNSYYHEVSESFVLQTIYHSTYWNPSFDRKKYVKQITSSLGIKLRKPKAI